MPSKTTATQQERASTRSITHDDRAVERVHRAFHAAVPGSADPGGHYVASEDPNPPGYTVGQYQVDDGTYRVNGGTWIFKFAGGHFVEAARVMPPGRYVNPPADLIEIHIGPEQGAAA